MLHGVRIGFSTWGSDPYGTTGPQADLVYAGPTPTLTLEEALGDIHLTPSSSSLNSSAPSEFEPDQ